MIELPEEEGEPLSDQPRDPAWQRWYRNLTPVKRRFVAAMLIALVLAVPAYAVAFGILLAERATAKGESLPRDKVGATLTPTARAGAPTPPSAPTKPAQPAPAPIQPTATPAPAVQPVAPVPKVPPQAPAVTEDRDDDDDDDDDDDKKRGEKRDEEKKKDTKGRR